MRRDPGANLDPFFVLFSFGGRLPRPPFWYALVAVGFVGGVAAYALLQLAISAPAIVAIFLPLLYALAAWIGIALAVKRLHDRDKSAGWLLPYGLLPCLFGQMANRMLSESSSFAGATATLILGGVLALCGFVEVALLSGTAGDNRFGPDPRLQSADGLD